ncbi:MAG: glutaminase A [Cyanobacteriota bacterium]|nr:glutaminase A [Cyanobacteriota bacterium]
MQKRLLDLFEAVAVDGLASAQAIIDRIEASGIQQDDHRLATTMARLEEHGDQPIDLSTFTTLVADEVLMLSRAFHRQLVIPDWHAFSRDIHTIYHRVAPDRSGANADYIPILRDADPEPWGVAICTVDGQRLAMGDVDIYHSIQSVSKPITYAHALGLEGEAFTHQFVGVEPSGRPFNALDLLPDQRPFNPCVNAGAIMMAGLVASGAPELDSRQITQQLMDLWGRLSGGLAEVRFSEETMLSERATADNNFAIAYLLRGRLGLPRGVDLHKMMDVYLSCCSIEMTARMLSIAAATLANGGVCPISGDQVLETDVVKRTLSVMQAAGMYDNAGTFSLEVGLPAKSGVAGAVLVVVPNLMGFATFSPRLDAYGNSVRGVRFCQELVDCFTFHQYDSLSGGRSGCKRDPRESQASRRQRDLGDLRWGALCGDRTALRVRQRLLDGMVAIALADGEVEDPELAAMGLVVSELMGHPPDPELLRTQAEQAARQAVASGCSAFTALLEQLRRERPQLDDNARGLILEAAFRVACADGLIEAEEEPLLRSLADALAISDPVLDLEIARFRDRAHAPAPAAAPTLAP